MRPRCSLCQNIRRTEIGQYYCKATGKIIINIDGRSGCISDGTPTTDAEMDGYFDLPPM